MPARPSPGCGCRPADDGDLKRVRSGVVKARAKDNLKALKRLTRRVDGELRFISDPPLLVPAAELMPAAETRDLRELLVGVVDSLRQLWDWKRSADVDFSEAYADQAERDHEALVAAIESGQVEADTGT